MKDRFCKHIRTIQYNTMLSKTQQRKWNNTYQTLEPTPQPHPQPPPPHTHTHTHHQHTHPHPIHTHPTPPRCTTQQMKWKNTYRTCDTTHTHAPHTITFYHNSSLVFKMVTADTLTSPSWGVYSWYFQQKLACYNISRLCMRLYYFFPGPKCNDAYAAGQTTAMMCT